jgi:hypothetical protein
MATIAGKACMKKMDLEAVSAPKIPATATQMRKNSATFLSHTGSDMHNDHIRPAARKPLYSPWLAASALVGSKRWAGKERKVFLPVVVQANISIHRIYRCSMAISSIEIYAIIDMNKGFFKMIIKVKVLLPWNQVKFLI